MNTKNSICMHYKTCGGCDNLELSYEEYLKLKQDYVQTILCDFVIEKVEEIIPSPTTKFYRNKMEFAVGGTVDNIFIGLRQKGKFSKIVDLKECYNFHPKIIEVFDIVKLWMKENNILPYDIILHKGKIRYVSIRHSKTFDDLMVNIVITGSKYQFDYFEKKIFENLSAKLIEKEKIGSIYVCINNKVSDNAYTDEIFKIYGKDFIEEKINEIKYKIFPLTFFQTNTSCCEKLYEIVVKQTEGGNVLDIYCGSGGITLQVAKKVQKIIGIDSSKTNILIANENANFNNISNVEFENTNAETFILKLAKSKFATELSTIIVDPPRAGLSKRVLTEISESGVGKIVYVSCNLETLKEDLKTFVRFYKIKKVIPVDMFPFTKHLETVTVLEHK